jgi:energy-coupling factor transport system permease protein
VIFRSYTEGRSFLHRLNPAVKLLAFSLLLIAPSLYLDPATPACFLLLSFALAGLLGRISPLRLLRSLGVFLALSTGVLLFNTLFYGGEKLTPLLQAGPLTIYREGLFFGLSVALRLLCITSYSAVFVYTTDPTLLASSLVHQLRLSYRIAYAVLAAYRFLPVLQRELSHIRDAHRIRSGYREGFGARLGRIRRYGIPLLTNGIRQAERMSISMDARGFGAARARTYYRPTTVSAGDYVFLAGAAAGIAGLLLLLTHYGLARGFLAGLAESLSRK